MKRYIAILLSFMMILSLSACGKNKKYDELIALLEDGKYDAARTYIDGLQAQYGQLEDGEEAADILALVPGKWTLTSAAEEGTPEVINMSEDATCIIGRDTYVWEVNKQTKTSLEIYICEAKQDKYVAQMNVAEDGKCTMTLNAINKDATTTTIGTYMNESHYELVEITADNWTEYFEVVELPKFGEYKADEFPIFSIAVKVVPKEEYKDRIDAKTSAVTMEASKMLASYDCILDSETQKYELSDSYQTQGAGEAVATSHEFWDDGESGYCITIGIAEYGLSGDKPKMVNYPVEVQVTKAEGTLYLRKEL